ncbi:MAG: FAD/NAD(P)-binding protein [Gammaproteobacteria bacterium]
MENITIAIPDADRSRHAARAPKYDVIIIGGGYAGVAAAIHLLRQSPVPPRLAIVEPRVRLGRGVAYDTRLSCHLLNTRAKHMSLRPDDEQHYTRWAQARAETKDPAPGVGENCFTPRGWFGDYARPTRASCTPGTCRAGRYNPSSMCSSSVRVFRWSTPC